jgi:Skp family chaperone for outer membrane proteins
VGKIKKFLTEKMSDTRLITYLKAFWSDWLTSMSGALSVPFGAAAIWWAHGPSTKALWTCAAILAFCIASYRVWRSERNSVADELKTLKRKHEEELTAMKAEIEELKRKPYDEEIGRQAEVLLNRLSPDGRTLLRHLLVNEPLEQGRRFRQDISQAEQDAQLSLAYGTGIVRYDEVRHPGNGAVIRTNYVINPRFHTVLQDMLY